ncbi:MAG TPA: putative dsRNA-binding protein, partial [Actinomycetota bacterium]|nr:putative dsRNA-binding protein [Actinomycetota bacterium]
ERGPDHQKEFTATVFVAGTEWGTGIGRSKKEAEQQAAHQAYVRLSERAEPAGAWGAPPTPEASADARAAAPRERGAPPTPEASADARAAAPRERGVGGAPEASADARAAAPRKKGA